MCILRTNTSCRSAIHAEGLTQASSEQTSQRCNERVSKSNECVFPFKLSSTTTMMMIRAAEILQLTSNVCGAGRESAPQMVVIFGI